MELIVFNANTLAQIRALKSVSMHVITTSF